MKKFTCVLKVLPLPAYGVQWNVQVKEPAHIYNTFWKFPLKLFQTCEEKVKFRHLMNAKVNARHQKFPHPYAQSGMREGLIRAGGGGGGGPVRVVLKHGTATKPPKVSAGGQRGVQGVHVRKCAVCAVIA